MTLGRARQPEDPVTASVRSIRTDEARDRESGGTRLGLAIVSACSSTAAGVKATIARNWVGCGLHAVWLPLYKRTFAIGLQMQADFIAVEIYRVPAQNPRRCRSTRPSRCHRALQGNVDKAITGKAGRPSGRFLALPLE